MDSITMLPLRMHGILGHRCGKEEISTFQHFKPHIPYEEYPIPGMPTYLQALTTLIFNFEFRILILNFEYSLQNIIDIHLGRTLVRPFSLESFIFFAQMQNND